MSSLQFCASFSEVRRTERPTRFMMQQCRYQQTGEQENCIQRELVNTLVIHNPYNQTQTHTVCIYIYIYIFIYIYIYIYITLHNHTESFLSIHKHTFWAHNHESLHINQAYPSPLPHMMYLVFLTYKSKFLRKHCQYRWICCYARHSGSLSSLGISGVRKIPRP